MHHRPILIGITGNIGSGKSTFCTLLEEHGHKVIYADEVAQQQLDDADSLKQLARRWGREIIAKGRADRKKIASIVFNDKAELDFLNSVIHPKTLGALQHITDNSAEKHLFFEVPLLFEAGMQRCFDFIVLIRADRAKRLQRLLKKSVESREQVIARMDAQIDDQGKVPLCNLVIDNSGSQTALRNSFRDFIKRLETIRHKPTIPFSS
jgi:dephospho-CoA kinase